MDLNTLYARSTLLRQRVKQAFMDDPQNAPMGFQSTVGASLAGLGGLAAVGGGAVGGVLHYGANEAERNTYFTPEALDRMRQFQRSLEATTPAQGLTNYVRHGSAIAGMPVLRSGETGEQFMHNFYENPLFARVHGSLDPDALAKGGWNPERQQHYQEFSKGPVRAEAQIAREIYRDPSRVRDLARGDLTDGLSAQHRRVNELVERMRQRLVQRGELAPNAPFEWWKTDRYKQFFQPMYDRADAAVSRATGNAVSRLGQVGDSGEIVRRRLARFAKTDREVAPMLRRMGLRGADGIERLPAEVQARLLGRFNAATGLGKTLAQDALPALKNNVGRYRVLAMAGAPGSMILRLAKRMRGGRNVALGIGAAGLGALGLGSLIHGYGRAGDVNAARARNETDLRRFVEALRGAVAPTQVPPPAASPAAPPATSRQQLAKSLFRSAASGLGDWWQRMQARYGGRGQA